MARKRITTKFTADAAEALKVADSGGSPEEVKDAFLASVKVEPAANIAFVGKAPWKPLKAVYSAQREVVKLPEDQSEPFYHEKANFIIDQYPHLYKRFKGKGDK